MASIAGALFFRQESTPFCQYPFTKAFIEQLEREHGATHVHICCECDGQPNVDSKTRLLFNEECPTHGRAWHRLMIRQPNGSLVHAMPLQPIGTPAQR
jgi:hypothetical protein